MISLRRLWAFLFFVFAVYFVARSEIAVAPSDSLKQVPGWLGRAPIPIACLSPGENPECRAIMVLWPYHDTLWLTQPMQEGTPFQVFWNSPHPYSCKLQGSIHSQLSVLDCPQLNKPWPYETIPMKRILATTQWRVLTLQHHTWAWQPVRLKTWLALSAGWTPVFDVPYSTVPGSPVITANGKYTIGMLNRTGPGDIPVSIYPSSMTANKSLATFFDLP